MKPIITGLLASIAALVSSLVKGLASEPDEDVEPDEGSEPEALSAE